MADPNWERYAAGTGLGAAVLRQAGKTAVGYVDLVVYSALDHEWQARS